MGRARTIKPRQLSMFTDKHVERNPIVRCFLNPRKVLINKLRLEGIFKTKNEHLGLDEFTHWNIMRHVLGRNPQKVGRRYFYN